MTVSDILPTFRMVVTFRLAPRRMMANFRIFFAVNFTPARWSCRLAVAVDEHTDEHGDDGRADDVEWQQRLDALGEQRDDEREPRSRRVAFDLSGNGAHGDLTSLCR